MTGRNHNNEDESATPTWGRDFKRLIFGTCVVIVLATGILALARTGLMHANSSSDDPLVANPALAGLCAGLVVMTFPFLLLEAKREDSGLRRQNLTSLLLLAVPTSALIELFAVSTWPFILGDKATPGSVAAILPTDPRAMALVFCFLLAGFAWMMTVVLAMTSWIGWVSILTVLGFLVGLAAVMGGAVIIFDNPPSLFGLMVCLALAVTGMGAMAATAAFRPIIAPPRMSARRRRRLAQRLSEQPCGR